MTASSPRQDHRLGTEVQPASGRDRGTEYRCPCSPKLRPLAAGQRRWGSHLKTQCEELRTGKFPKNVSTSALKTGMAFTLASFAGFSPQDLKKTFGSIRELLLQRAHYAWWTQRRRIATDNAKSIMTRKSPRLLTTTQENVVASRQTEPIAEHEAQKRRKTLL